MFSGIVEVLGRIVMLRSEHDCLHMSISPGILFDDIAIGDSIAVNGVCLTVTAFDQNEFHVSLVPETLRVTNLSEININDEVNLERSLKYSSRIGGHYVQGHVDACGEIIELVNIGEGAIHAKIGVPSQLMKYIVNKGFIGIDGMSITVIETGNDWFTVTFIPHTQEVTLVKQYHIGKKVNIEVDMMGKYIEKFLENRV